MYNRVIGDAVMDASIETSHYNDMSPIMMNLVLTEAYRNYEISLYIILNLEKK